MKIKTSAVSQLAGIALLCLLASGCLMTEDGSLAPVVKSQTLIAGHRNIYVVQTGDSIYSVAWAYELDYQRLADWNRLSPPFVLQVGQKLYIAGPASLADLKIKPMAPPPLPGPANQAIVAPAPLKMPMQGARPETLGVSHSPIKSGHWLCPVHGGIIRNFRQNNNKGIDIAAPMGTPVRAAADGNVVYAGTGVRGYGRLVIVRHSNDYLSAYAFNRSLAITQGMRIKQGDKIAEVGQDNHGRAASHFEVRLRGVPVFPQCD